MKSPGEHLGILFIGTEKSIGEKNASERVVPLCQ